MMKTIETAKLSGKREAAPPHGWLSGRTALLSATALVGAGAALNRDWLVAAGIAPLILAVLPCVAMCALGVWCAKASTNASCEKHGAKEKNSEARRHSPLNSQNASGVNVEKTRQDAQQDALAAITNQSQTHGAETAIHLR